MEPDREDVAGPGLSTRVVRPDDGEVQPLYPHTRLLKTSVLEAVAAAGEAQEKLEQVRAEAHRVVEKARREVESVRQQAYQEGSKEAIAQIGELVGAIRRAAHKFNQDVAERAVQLAETFAREILHIECKIRPDAMKQLVASVLECAKNYNAITVLLHPEDLEIVRAHSDELLERLPFAESIQFREDPDLDRHGCRIETEMGTYDGSLAVQLARLHKHLLERGGLGQSGSQPDERQEA